MVDNSKALVSRAALERVLARAAELQTASGEEPERVDTLTEAQVEELGVEVGLSPQHIRQALAEERAHIEPLAMEGSGLAFSMFGPDRVAAQRVVRGRPERLLATLDRWMQKDQALRVLRQRTDFISWEPSRGVLGALRRAFGSGDFALFRADEIAAGVVLVDQEFSLVRLQATFTGLRNQMAGRTAWGVVLGALASGAAVLMGFMTAVAVGPVLIVPLASYYSARRVHEVAIQRAQLSLEQVLDRLERGETDTPSLLRIVETALPSR